MKYNVTLNGKTYEVVVEKGEATLENVTAAVAPAPVAAPAPAAAPAAAPVAAPAGAGEVVASPMPGNILEVKVAPGTAVKAGQLLVILEAMKMENDIVAPRDGVVSQVLVAKGATVDTDTALVVLA